MSGRPGPTGSWSAASEAGRSTSISTAIGRRRGRSARASWPGTVRRPTLVKCCLLERGIERDGQVAVVPWGAELAKSKKPCSEPGGSGMNTDHDDAWGDAIHSLAEPRTEKPRRTGITSVIDKGLGPRATDDLIETAAPVIDHVKLGFGTTAALPADQLRRKIASVDEAGIVVYPGGTLLEAAWATGRMAAFITRAHALGFTGLEVSDGTVDLPAADRARGDPNAASVSVCEVVTEVGSKDPARQPSPIEMVDRLHADLELGASLVTIEARESGLGTGIFDMSGDVVSDVLDGPGGCDSRPAARALGGSAAEAAGPPDPPVRGQRQPRQHRSARGPGPGVPAARTPLRDAPRRPSAGGGRAIGGGGRAAPDESLIEP